MKLHLSFKRLFQFSLASEEFQADIRRLIQLVRTIAKRCNLFKN